MWKLIPARNGKAIALEIRNQDSFEVRYASIDLVRYQLIFDDLTFEDSWWTSIFLLHGNLLVFYAYPDSQNPEVKKFFAVDLPTRKIIWQSDSFVVVDAAEGKLYGYTRHGDVKDFQEIDIYKNTAKAISEESILVTANKRDITVKHEQIAYPFLYAEDSPHFPVVFNYIAQNLHVHPVKGCEYLEFRHYIIISYYFYESKNLVNYLLIIDKNGTLLHHEKINECLSGIGSDTFFIINQQLIFIKEKNQIVSYEL